MRLIARFVFVLIVLPSVLDSPEASAGVITITLTERDAFFSQDPGAEHVGLLDVPTFAPIPNSMFDVEGYSFTLPDESGGDVLFSDSKSGLRGTSDFGIFDQEDVQAFVTTDANGDAHRLIGITPAGGEPELFITNPIFFTFPVIAQQVDYSIGLNNLSNPDVLFWSLNSVTLNPPGPPLVAGDIFRSGFYELTAEDSSAVPEPSSLTLLGIGLVGTAVGAWWRRRSAGQSAAA